MQYLLSIEVLHTRVNVYGGSNFSYFPDIRRNAGSNSGHLSGIGHNTGSNFDHLSGIVAYAGSNKFI
ncbi:MAG: hypothetical protein V4560_17080 [Bacteroidota bacterium]